MLVAMYKRIILQSLREHEGFSPTVYKDTEGYDTIGIGRLVDKKAGGGITEEEALYLLNNDLDKVWSQLQSKLPWVKTAPDNIQYALIHMAFQMGIGGLLQFKNTLRYIEAKEYNRAADNAMDSKWARQTPNRAAFVCNLIRSNNGQST